MVDSTASAPSENHKNNSNKKRKLIIGLIAIATIAVVLFYFLYGKSLLDNLNKKTNDASDIIDTQEEVYAISVSANEAIYNSGGDVKTAYDVYDTAIKNASADQKNTMYIQKASVALNYYDNETALKTAMLVIENIGEKKTNTPYDIVAICHERMGDYLKAKEYYQKAFDTLTAIAKEDEEFQGQRTKDQLEYYQERINDMASKIE